MTEESENNAQYGEIQCTLINGSLPEYDLEDSSFLLPTSMDRAALSKMINDMLALAKPVAFDIIFNNEPLRTSLAEKLEEHRIQSESTIVLTYAVAVTEPDEEEISTLNDWVSGISYTEYTGYFATSCYDGNISVYSARDRKKKADFLTNNKSASAIAIHSDSSLGTKIEIACGHMNGLLEIHCIDTDASKPKFSLVSSSQSATDAISTIAISANGEFLVASGYGPDILVYDNKELMEKCKDIKLSKNRTKRPLDDGTVAPISTLAKHTKAVTCLEFLRHKEALLVSSSIDWNIAIWDVAKASLLSIYNTGKAVTCLSVSLDCSEVITGHEEGTIGLWDLRHRSTGAILTTIDDFSNATLIPRASAAMFERLVTAVHVHPEDENIFAAISLDGHAALIDKRYVKIPLQLVILKNNDEPDRGTGCCWISASELVCCTASGNVRLNDFKELKQNESI